MAYPVAKKQEFINALAVAGPRGVAAACEQTGVKRSTAYLWRSQCPEFAAAWDAAMQAKAQLLLERALDVTAGLALQGVEFVRDPLGDVVHDKETGLPVIDFERSQIDRDMLKQLIAALKRTEPPNVAVQINNAPNADGGLPQYRLQLPSGEIIDGDHMINDQKVSPVKADVVQQLKTAGESDVTSYNDEDDDDAWLY